MRTAIAMEIMTDEVRAKMGALKSPEVGDGEKLANPDGGAVTSGVPSPEPIASLLRGGE